MAIDTREKRQSVVGINMLSGPSPTPNAANDLEWRQEVGYGYSGIAASAVAGQPFYLREGGYIPSFLGLGVN